MNPALPPSDQLRPPPGDGEAHLHDLPPSPAPPPLAPIGRAGMWPWLLSLGAALSLAGLFLIGYLPRISHAAELAAAAEQSERSLLRVRVAKPKRVPAATDLALPGAVAATRDTMIYARSTGYVRSWKFDLGDTVKNGDLLAEIDQPELDQELIQAKATLDQSRLGIELQKGNVGLCKLKLQRQKELGPNLTPQEGIDNAQSAFDIATVSLVVAEAKVKADAANVHRLEELVAFGRVLAPFDGVITQRLLEVGNLVNGSAGTAAQPLFHLMQIDPILVLVDVPQVSAASISLGQAAAVHPQAGSDSAVGGRIAHIANALDPTTRTMRVQVLCDNHDNRLLPGMYVQAVVSVPTGRELLEISSGCLLLSGAGTRVAVVQADGRLALRTVEIARDNGATLEIAAGLRADDQVVTNPAGRIEEGLPVEVAKDAATPRP
jgi:membrane fusion protein (multidrug efflux system)